MNNKINLQTTISNIERRFGPRAIMYNGSIRENLFTQSIPTGIPQLDQALGIGGIPRGRITDIYGLESAGKTTLCNWIIAQAQKMDLFTAYVEMGHELNRDYAITCGVDPDRLLISQPNSAENALNIVESLVNAGLGLVVLDSVAAMSPSYELEGDMGDSHEVHGKLMAQAMRKLCGLVSKNNTALIFTNQLRVKQGVMFGDPFNSTGGKALRFFASIRISLWRQKSLKHCNEITGQQVKAKITKNNLAPAFRQAHFNIVWGH